MSEYNLKSTGNGKFIITYYDETKHTHINMCQPISLADADKLLEHLNSKASKAQAERAKLLWRG